MSKPIFYPKMWSLLPHGMLRRCAICHSKVFDRHITTILLSQYSLKMLLLHMNPLTHGPRWLINLDGWCNLHNRGPFPKAWLAFKMTWFLLPLLAKTLVYSNNGLADTPSLSVWWTEEQTCFNYIRKGDVSVSAAAPGERCIHMLSLAVTAAPWITRPRSSPESRSCCPVWWCCSHSYLDLLRSCCPSPWSWILTGC